jgi:BlaI family transcriptional regulator, penicillinase repressor
MTRPVFPQGSAPRAPAMTGALACARRAAAWLWPVAPRYATQCNTELAQDQSKKRSSKMDESLPDLGDLEREVMQLVWAKGPVTAEAVREQLARRLKESTVRTVLRRLEDKGYVAHTVDGRTYVYQATEGRGRVAAKAVQRIVDWFCNGSVEEVLVGMVDTAMLDRKRLRMLTEKITQTKGKK